MIKLFASDIDGTILPADEHISEEIKQAIRDLAANGIQFMLVSGRDRIALRRIMARLGTECPAIGLNGAVTFRADGTSAIENPDVIPDAACDEIFRLGEAHDCYYVCHCLTGNYTNMTDEAAKDALIETFMRDRGYDETKAAAFADEYIEFAYAVPCTDYAYIKQQGILKVEFYFRDPSERAFLTEQFAALSDTAACPTPYSSIEMTHADATKGNALDTYRTLLGFSRSEVAVIGDAENDFSMFLPESTRFAMGNAHPFLKEHASHVVADVNHNGFVEAVQIVLAQNNSDQ